MKTLEDLFIDELSDMHDAEKQLLKELPRLAESTTCAHLRKAVMLHMKETLGHVSKLDAVFKLFGKTVRNRSCETTRGLLEEGHEFAERFEASPAINAALICALQRIEHHEIASYGCLHEWAVVLENDAAARLLREILDEEKAANAALTELARSHCNSEALGDLEDDTDEDE